MEGIPINKEKQLIDELQEILRAKIPPSLKGMENYKKIRQFSDELQRKYPREWYHSRLYHILNGSQMHEEHYESLDLPGGEIERFIREEL